jgi:hypothetical protein
MNTVAILPEILMSLLQKQNVKRDIVEKIDVEKKIEVVEKSAE